MQAEKQLDALAVERTLLAAERTFSAWVRTGLACVGGGLAIARALVFDNIPNKIAAEVIGGLLIVLGAGIFIFAMLDYRRAFLRLAREGLSKRSLTVMVLITLFLLVITALVFWLILQ
jgi:putative membrane protein